MKFNTCSTLGTPLSALTKVQCSVLLQQAKRLGFYELSGGSQAAVIGTDTSILTKAVYDALLIDATAAGLRLPQSKIFNPNLTGTEAVTIGSNDNSTPDGQTIIVGQSIPMFEGEYVNLSPAQYAELENVFGRGNASVDFSTLGIQFFCGDFQTVVGLDNKAIPVKATFIGDPSGMQLNDLTRFKFRLELYKGWFRSAKVVDLAFNHNLL